MQCITNTTNSHQLIINFQMKNQQPCTHLLFMQIIYCSNYYVCFSNHLSFQYVPTEVSSPIMHALMSFQIFIGTAHIILISVQFCNYKLLTKVTIYLSSDMHKYNFIVSMLVIKQYLPLYSKTLRDPSKIFQ